MINLTFLGTVLATSLANRITERPNIIFILTDDHRFDAVGYAGNPYIRTPVMDSLARHGTIYSNARVSNPISCASRASIMTGQYSICNGVYDFSTPLSAEQQAQTYPAILKEKGYYTGFIGKYGVDRELKRMTDELKAQEIDGNTVFILMGDNGFYLGEYGMAGKLFHHEEALRVPLFVYDPRRAGGKTDTRNALNIDIAPTILAYAGLKCDAMQGKDLNRRFARKSIWFEYGYKSSTKQFFIPTMEGILDGRNKLVCYSTPGSTWTSLYDVREEAGETDDLASSHMRKTRRMTKKMIRLKEKAAKTEKDAISEHLFYAASEINGDICNG